MIEHAKATSSFRVKMLDKERWQRLADGVAIALVVSLPWSTSATGILAGIWLIVVIPTIDAALMRRVLLTPGGGLPVLFCLVAVIGMLWALDISGAERWNGVKSLTKFLYIPLLIVQFYRSERAAWLLIGFVLSCAVMLIVSTVLLVFPDIPWFWGQHGGRGVPVKDYIAQSAEFTACIFLLAPVVHRLWLKNRRLASIGLLLLCLAFLANVFYVATSRTALVVIPVLLLLFAWRYLTIKGAVGLFLAAIAVSALAWALAPPLSGNVSNVINEVRSYQSQGERTRAGERLEFWRKSLAFIADAPLIGHGTGSITNEFRKTVQGQTGNASLASSNPHNQTFAVAIQLGLMGGVILFAMWFAHLRLFLGSGFAAWAGLLVVVQNIVGCLFNSHLFDFTQGWGYVIGVGVAAGLVMRQTTAPKQIAAYPE